MATHLSVELRWHDSGWNGCICKMPHLNSYCRYIGKGKDETFEKQHSGVALSSLTHVGMYENKKEGGCYIPCRGMINAFSEQEYSIRYNIKNHGMHEESLKSYSCYTKPYENKWKNESLKTFWGALEKEKSLIIYYSNITPFMDDKKRIIVGIGRLKDKSKIAPDGYCQCIQNYPEEGFRLPYQEYINNNIDASHIVVPVPKNYEKQFKFFAEHVSNEGALAVCEDLSVKVDAIRRDIKCGTVTLAEDWNSRQEWLQGVIREVWADRGMYPGISGVLLFLGFTRGTIYRKDVLIPIEKADGDTLKHTLERLDGKASPEKEYEDDFARAKANWTKYPAGSDKRKLLELLMRMELSKEQVEKIVDKEKRKSAGIALSEKEILNNPYRITEDEFSTVTSNNKMDCIGLETIDHGMVPYSPGGPGTCEPNDIRRIRAAIIDELRKAADEGDTLLHADDLLGRVRERFKDRRICEPDLLAMKSEKIRKFYEEKLVFLGENADFIAMAAMRDQEELIKESVLEFMKKRYKDDPPNWGNIIETVIGSEKDKQADIKSEQKAREEKIDVLNKLFSQRFSVLAGKAGTGKTKTIIMLIKALIDVRKNEPSDFLILTPTGKASIRIIKDMENAGLAYLRQRIMTIHLHLKKSDWLNEKNELRQSGGSISSAKVIIIDEASMVTTDLFSTLLKSINIQDIDRLILIGDPHQLPPIGPGRPFYDTVRFLSSSKECEAHLGILEQQIRFKNQNNLCKELAEMFRKDKKPGDINLAELLKKISTNPHSDNNDLFIWDWNEEDFAERLYGVLKHIGIYDIASYKRIIGFEDKDISKCESWQILTPYKLHPRIGSSSLNLIVQKNIWGNNPLDLQPGDKVMQIVNKKTIPCNPPKRDQFVANGEIGLVKGVHKKGLNIQFSDQPDFEYNYDNSEKEKSDEMNLELAYAITIHKAQGSDFKNVILIIPKEGKNISIEMLYTALTRFKETTHILVEGGIETLIDYKKNGYSETDKRNTNLFTLIERVIPRVAS